MDVEMRRTICRLVAGVLIADDELQREEDDFLGWLLAEMDIPESERSLVFPIVNEAEAITTMKALPASVRQEAMELFLDAACADGQVVDRERSYLRAVARTLGIGTEECDSMIDDRLLFGG